MKCAINFDPQVAKGITSKAPAILQTKKTFNNDIQSNLFKTKMLISSNVIIERFCTFFKYKDGNLLHPLATPESDPSRCCFRYPTMMALRTSGWPCIPWRMYATWRGPEIIVKLTLVKWIPPKEVVNKKGCILPRDGLYSFGVGLSPSPKSGEILVIRTRGFEHVVLKVGSWFWDEFTGFQST